jgi:beta propeller repeat protein
MMKAQRWFLLLAALLPGLVAATPAAAVYEFPVCTALGDAGLPVISGDIAVWTDARNDPGDWSNLDIYGYDLSTGREFAVCTAPGVQAFPAISGDVVVWTDGRDDPGDWTNLDIYGYDLSDGQELAICLAPGSQGLPVVSGDLVVWTDARNDPGDWTNLDIYGYNLSTKQEFPVCTAPGDQALIAVAANIGVPAISGSVVVWTDARSDPGDWTNLDVYGYDLSAHLELPICTASGDQGLPVISGNIVAWTDCRNDPGDWTNMDIYGYNLSTHLEFPVCTAPGHQGLPVIGGDVIAWTDARSDPGEGVNLDVYGYKLSTGQEFPICTAPGSQGLPVIGEDIVAWTDARADPGDWTNLDVYGYDLSTGQEFPISTAPGLQGLPVISGQTVLWTDARDAETSGLDIYGALLDSEGPPNVSFADFEDRVSPWTHFAAGPGEAVTQREIISPDGAHSGRYAAAAEVSDQATTGLRLPLLSGVPTVILRAWVYVADRTEGSSSTFVGFALSEGYPSSYTGWGQALGWEILSDTASRYQLGGAAEAAALGLPSESWHLVQVQYTSATSKLTLWLDGVLVAEKDAPGAAGQSALYAVLGALGESAAAHERVYFDDAWVTLLGNVGGAQEPRLSATLEGPEYVGEEKEYTYVITYGSGSFGASGSSLPGASPGSDSGSSPALPGQVFVGLTLGGGYSLISAVPPPAVLSPNGNPAWALPTPGPGEVGQVQVQLSTPPTGPSGILFRALWLWLTGCDDDECRPQDPPEPPQPPDDPCDQIWGCPPDQLPQTVRSQLGPDLWVRKEGPSFAAPGDTIFYWLTIGNDGVLPSDDVALLDQMPGLLGGGERIVTRLAEVYPGETWSGGVSGTLPWGVQAGTVLLNTATVTGTPEDVGPLENWATWATTVLAARDPNQIAVDPTGGVDRGEQLTYTLECENVGLGTAYGVYAKTTLSPRMDDTTLRIPHPAGLSYDPGSRTLVWDVGVLPPGQGSSTTYTVTVADDAPRARPVTARAVVYFPSVPEETATNILSSMVRGSFPDVLWDHWAITQIEVAHEAGIVFGYWNGSYKPDLAVTRDQMAVFIARALAGGDENLPDLGCDEGNPPFTDVLCDHWARKYIQYVKDQNVVQGYEDKTYRPTLAVNRAQMAVFIARALVTPSGDAGVPPGPQTPTFPDVTPGGEWGWCYDHVEYIASHEIASGYWDGYHPERVCSRDQMAVYIQRAFELPM